MCIWSTSKFLEFMVTWRGIEENPSQVKVVLESPVPTSKEEVKPMIGRLAALRRFISCFTNRLYPFFSILQKARASSWTDKCKNVFKSIKQYLSEPSILSSPNRRRVVHVPCRVKLCYQHLSLPTWPMQCHLICKQSFGGHWNEIFSNGTNGPCITICS